MTKGAAIVVLVAIFSVAFSSSVPQLNVGGFSWAENLAFDGLGGLFVTESVRGELWRISYDSSGGNYSAKIHIGKGFKQFGGLAPVADGHTIYAAAVFDDKSKAILATSTSPPRVGEQSYTTVIRNMENLANGMALVPSENALYCTAEAGTLSKVDIAAGIETIVSTPGELEKPDGLWFDIPSGKLIIGELVSKRMKVFDIATQKFSAYFAGASSLNSLHLLDDFTLVNGVNTGDIGQSMVIATDWTGKQIIQFTLDGTVLKTVPIPDGIKLYEPTSIRRGKGPGFDPDSFYLTEGGGLTKHVDNRRVLQLAAGIV